MPKWYALLTNGPGITGPEASGILLGPEATLKDLEELLRDPYSERETYQEVWQLCLTDDGELVCYGSYEAGEP